MTIRGFHFRCDFCGVLSPFVAEHTAPDVTIFPLLSLGWIIGGHRRDGGRLMRMADACPECATSRGLLNCRPDGSKP